MMEQFVGHLKAHPEISHAITKHVNHRNTWVLASLMNQHDDKDREDIRDQVLDCIPEHRQAKKRPIIEGAILDIYKAAKRIPSIHLYPGDMGLVGSGASSSSSDPMTLTGEFCGLAELPMERISEKPRGRWGQSNGT